MLTCTPSPGHSVILVKNFGTCISILLFPNPTQALGPFPWLHSSTYYRGHTLEFVVTLNVSISAILMTCSATIYPPSTPKEPMNLSNIIQSLNSSILFPKLTSIILTSLYFLAHLSHMVEHFGFSPSCNNFNLCPATPAFDDIHLSFQDHTETGRHL